MEYKEYIISEFVNDKGLRTPPCVRLSRNSATDYPNSRTRGLAPH